jgi:hypothetical protein
MSREHLCKLNADELRWVLVHELVHIKRGDLFWESVAWALRTVHWFNPLVWVALRLLRHDREVACDARVLELRQRSNAGDYGEALVKVTESSMQMTRMPGFLGISEEGRKIKDRLGRILDYRRTSLTVALAGILVTFAFGTLFLTKPSGSWLASGDRPADHFDNYKISLWCLQIPQAERTAFETLRTSGQLENAIELPGVEIIAAPMWLARANGERQKIRSVNEMRYGTQYNRVNNISTPSNFQARDVGWIFEYQITGRRLISQFDWVRFLGFRESSPMSENYVPQFTSVQIPFNGEIKNSAYSLLGMADNAKSMESGLIAIIGKFDLEQE